MTDLNPLIRADAATSSNSQRVALRRNNREHDFVAYVDNPELASAFEAGWQAGMRGETRRAPGSGVQGARVQWLRGYDRARRIS